jgi:hypothetical protein
MLISILSILLFIPIAFGTQFNSLPIDMPNSFEYRVDLENTWKNVDFSKNDFLNIISYRNKVILDKIFLEPDKLVHPDFLGCNKPDNSQMGYPYNLYCHEQHPNNFLEQKEAILRKDAQFEYKFMIDRYANENLSLLKINDVNFYVRNEFVSDYGWHRIYSTFFGDDQVNFFIYTGQHRPGHFSQIAIEEHKDYSGDWKADLARHNQELDEYFASQLPQFLQSSVDVVQAENFFNNKLPLVPIGIVVTVLVILIIKFKK